MTSPLCQPCHSIVPVYFVEFTSMQIPVVMFDERHPSTEIKNSICLSNFVFTSKSPTG